MPKSYLWATSSSGKVYSLSSYGEQWQDLPYYGIDIKRVSAVGRCIWAIGGDHQIYVFVLPSDVPIRYKEISYENQRWNPKDGFSNHLLPTDRPRWSSRDGLTPRFLDQIKLPTLSWQWEGDWLIEDNLDGQPLGAEGWMYAVDFPATYMSEKRLTSFVRRRKWVRYRRYNAMNKWSSVPSIHRDPVQEPFIDVAVGGLELPGGDGDTLAVWAVTVNSQIIFRTHVNYNNPEGESWVRIPTPQKTEVNQVSVGPTGLVWAVVWDGKAIVRTGVTRFSTTGSDWRTVDFPNESSRLLQVSVGIDVVWAVSRDGKVWFRKGIRGIDAGNDDHCACGDGWVEMVGSMSQVTVGPDDQVWAVSKEEPNTVFFRTGINPKELYGKTWKAITVPVYNRLSPTNSEASLSMQLSQATTTPTKQGPVSIQQAAQSADGDSGVLVSDSTAQSDDDQHSAPINETRHYRSSSGDVSSICENSLKDQSLQRSPKLFSSHSSLVHGANAAAEFEFFDDEMDFVWCWISGSGCYVDASHLPNWFSSGKSRLWSNRKEPWRKDIISKLGCRYEKEVKNFKDYELAIEKCSWTKTGKGHIWVDSKQVVECTLELEQISSAKGLDSGTLACKYVYCGFKQIQTSLIDITCVMITHDRNKRVALSVYTSERAQSNTPIRLVFTSEEETEDWAALLSITCCEIRGIEDRPHPDAVWATTNHGFIFAHNPEKSLDKVDPTEMFWRQFGGHLKVVETSAAGVVWGIGYNSIPWVYTGGWGGGIFQGLSTSPAGINMMMDVRHMHIYENQRWNPVTGFSAHGLPTDRYMWSDRTGKYECTKDNTHVPSKSWQWVTDWQVDFMTPNGVDKEGWQYAKDFPFTYHSHKGFTDYVRRRRWFRQCKLITTGPWEEMESIRLLDISFQVDHPGTPTDPVNLWAVDVNGNVLFRHGVTKQLPQGTSWEHVTADTKFVSVSVGGDGRVWGVSRNGSAFLRNGVTLSCPTGAHWFHVEPPDKNNPLKQVSAGATSVWSVDRNNGLWIRQEVMPMFPEGTCWKQVCKNVRHVSVGSDDQVWAVLENLETTSGTSQGVICRRNEITDEDKVGTSWESALPGGWCHVSIRGCSPK